MDIALVMKREDIKEMKITKEILAEPISKLNRDQFALFGEILDPHRTISIDLGEGPPTVEIFTAPFRGFSFDEMSRHVHSCQTFFPIEGREFVIAVAPPTDNNDPYAMPGLDEIRAFVIDGSYCINLHKGCWHTTPFPFNYKTHVVSLQSKRTFEEDLDIKKMQVEFHIRLE
jgi:hypothetical protein